MNDSRLHICGYGLGLSCGEPAPLDVSNTFDMGCHAPSPSRYVYSAYASLVVEFESVSMHYDASTNQYQRFFGMEAVALQHLSLVVEQWQDPAIICHVMPDTGCPTGVDAEKAQSWCLSDECQVVPIWW